MALTEINNYMPACTPQSQPGLCRPAQDSCMGMKRCAQLEAVPVKAPAPQWPAQTVLPSPSRAGQGRVKPSNLAMLQQTFIGKKKWGSLLQHTQNFKLFLHQIMEGPYNPKDLYQCLWETIWAVGSITAHQTNTMGLGEGWMTLFWVGWL